MPKFKTVTVVGRNAAGVEEKLVAAVHVNTDGLFYASIPSALLDAIQDRKHIMQYPVNGTLKMGAKSFDELMSAIKSAHSIYLTPEIIKEPVIRYNIESHVMFAADGEGNIYPNASFPGAKWGSDNAGPDYGDHHSCNRNPGGYSLVIGAKAMLKITHKYGDKSNVAYEHYYAGGSHLGRDNAAQLLNSWGAMDVGPRPKEIPYSDQAAMFFHKLLLGMAEMNRRVQEMTFTQDKIHALIDQSSSIKLLEVA